MNDYASLNTNQRRIFDAAMEWWKGDRSEPFEISGPPGSGKTYLINTIIDYLGILRHRVAPLAYTGAAAINMRIHGMENAKTAHSWLYVPVLEPILDKDGNQIIDPKTKKPKMKIRYVERDHIPDIDLFLVDEGSTIPPNMRVTIEKHHIPVIVAGDIDQLPPVHGNPAYLNDPRKIHFLTEIMRQAQDSGIVYISQMVKNGEKPHCGLWKDAYVIHRNQITLDMLLKSKIILCGRNATRDYYNEFIRATRGFEGQLPMPGERVVCRKNNWNIATPDGINLTNGLLGVCLNYPKPTYNRNEDSFILDFAPDMGSDDLVSNAFYGLECSYTYFTSNSKDREALKNDPLLKNERFEFGYAITTHMSQGSEYDNGIYIEESLNKHIDHKLNYVGVTRFRKFCIYVVRDDI